MTADLIAFLTARLDEDEAAAREALKRTTTTRRWMQGQWVEETIQPPEWRRSAWPPARVLADLAAKRVLLGQREWLVDVSSDDTTGMTAIDNVIRAFAAAYADHVAYRQEWRL